MVLRDRNMYLVLLRDSIYVTLLGKPVYINHVLFELHQICKHDIGSHY